MSERERVVCPVFLYASHKSHTIGGTRCISMLSNSPCVSILGFPSGTPHKYRASPTTKIKNGKLNVKTDHIRQRSHLPSAAAALGKCEVHQTQKPAHAFCMYMYNHLCKLTGLNARAQLLHRSLSRSISLVAHTLPFFFKPPPARSILNSSRPGPWVSTILEPCHPPRRHHNLRQKYNHHPFRPEQ